MTPRGRIVMVGVFALLTGVTLPGIGLVFIGQMRAGALNICDSGIPGASLLCSPVREYSGQVVWLLWLLVLAAAVVAILIAARWCLRPIAEVTGQITHVGPQNLGHRIRPHGDDELARLGRAVDEMMERISAGYEGQRRFAANASHELRTPLAVQRTLIEVGMDRTLTGEQLELLTGQLLATNERNERLIEGLLTLSESDQGLHSRLPQRLDEIVTAVLAVHADRAGKAGVTVRSVLAPVQVIGERVLLERLVTNLVENGIKYNRPGGTLTVVVDHDPALTVVNTGQVVPAESVAMIFEPFRRLAGDRTDHSGGAGLGLAIARSITQAHDGLIAARPGDDGGLHIDVHLPLAD